MTTWDFLSGGSDGAMYTKTGAIDWSEKKNDEDPPKIRD